MDRWVGRLLLALLIPPLLIELGLQTGALVVAWSAERTAGTAIAAGEPASLREPCAALCVGDSFTHGYGASCAAASYPAVLERELRRAPLDGRSRVAIHAWPSRNSRELIEQLGGQIAAEQPRYLIVLIGVNDLWSRPSRGEVREPSAAASAPAASPRRGAAGGLRSLRRTADFSRRELRLLIGNTWGTTGIA